MKRDEGLGDGGRKQWVEEEEEWSGVFVFTTALCVPLFVVSLDVVILVSY